MLSGWVAAAVAAAAAIGAAHALGRAREAVARACHELRGPLTAARLGLSLQLRGDPAGAERLHAIDGELDRAVLALDDLRDAGRRELAEPQLGEPERVDLDLLAQVAVIAAEGHARRARAAVRRASPAGGAQQGPSGAIVWGDPARLAQALGNLIANAIEHGGAEVTVDVVSRARVVRIEVCDDGPGLPAPVAALARRPRHGRGTRGRGLAISLAIARRHGGTIAAAPALAGARVVMELPAAGAPAGRETH